MLCDCPQSINSIPKDAKNRGFEVLEIDQDEPTFKVFNQKTLILKKIVNFYKLNLLSHKFG